MQNQPIQLEIWLCKKWINFSASKRFIISIALSISLTMGGEKFHSMIEKRSFLNQPDLFAIIFGFLTSMFFYVLLTRYIKEMLALKKASLRTAKMNAELSKINDELTKYVSDVNEANLKLEETQKMLSDANKELKKISNHDSLTGLHSRYYFDESILRIEAEAKRHNFYVWAIIADLNNLKSINDNLGHQAGDEVLKFVSQKLKMNLRESDNCYRIGGDEFAIIGNDQSPEDVRALVFRMLEDMKTWTPEINGIFLKITMSLGYSAKKIMDNENMQSIIKEADEFMYRHKNGDLK